jgi:hypothetical protein
MTNQQTRGHRPARPWGGGLRGARLRTLNLSPQVQPLSKGTALTMRSRMTTEPLDVGARPVRRPFASGASGNSGARTPVDQRCSAGFGGPPSGTSTGSN